MNRRIKYLTWANTREEKEETTHSHAQNCGHTCTHTHTHARTHSVTRATRITMTTMTKTTTTATTVILIMLNLYSRRKPKKKTPKRITNKNAETIGNDERKKKIKYVK